MRSLSYVAPLLTMMFLTGCSGGEPGPAVDESALESAQPLATCTDRANPTNVVELFLTPAFQLTVRSGQSTTSSLVTNAFQEFDAGLDFFELLSANGDYLTLEVPFNTSELTRIYRSGLGTPALECEGGFIERARLTALALRAEAIEYSTFAECRFDGEAVTLNARPTLDGHGAIFSGSVPRIGRWWLVARSVSADADAFEGEGMTEGEQAPPTRVGFSRLSVVAGAAGTSLRINPSDASRNFPDNTCTIVGAANVRAMIESAPPSPPLD